MAATYPDGHSLSCGSREWYPLKASLVQVSDRCDFLTIDRAAAGSRDAFENAPISFEIAPEVIVQHQQTAGDSHSVDELSQSGMS